MKQTNCWNCNAEVPTINYKTYIGIPICPNCGCKYPEKPKLESQLSVLQDEYLELREPRTQDAEGKSIDNPRSKNVYNKLFNKLYELTFNVICSKLKGSAMSLSKEEIGDMTQWSLIKLLSYYQNKPNFKISGSFTGYISCVVLYPLYNKKKKLKNKNEISYNAPLSKNGDNDSMTLLDRLSQKEDDKINLEKGLVSYQSELLINQINLFLETTVERIFERLEMENNKKSFSSILLLLACYKHYFAHRNDRFFTEVWKTSTLELHDIFKGSLTILKESLM